jgi:carboxylesterase type B
MFVAVVAVLVVLSTLTQALSTTVDVGYSKYKGTQLPNGITQWLGIGYAAPPLGDLRFRAPQHPTYNHTLQIADTV